MKRMLTWSLGMGSVAVIIAFVVSARSQSITKAFAESAKSHAAKSQAAAGADRSKAAPASHAAAPTAKPEAGLADESATAGKVAYTFPDDAAMRKFAEQSQQRQAILLRMSVLRAYWTEEQANLMEMDKRFAADYGLDVTKSYLLDARRRALIEQNMPATPGVPAPGSPLSSETPSPKAQ